MMESRDQEFQRLTLRAFEPSLDCRIYYVFSAIHHYLSAQ